MNVQMPDCLTSHCTVVNSDVETLNLWTSANFARNLPNEIKESRPFFGR